MFGNLQALGYGIVGFAIIIGIGTVTLQKFSASVGCGSGLAGEALTFNESATTSTAACYNSTGGTYAANNAGTNIIYLNGQMGTSGLAGWTPAIVAFTVGMMFLGAFLIGKGNKVYA